MRKPTRTQLRNKADLLYSKHIRAIGYCEAAGATMANGDIECSPKLECAHIISRGYNWTRTFFDDDGNRNAVCLCSKHHRWFTANPVEWGRWVEENIGADVYEEILRRSQRREKFDWESELARLEDG